jgi:hypothetical protein
VELSPHLRVLIAIALAAPIGFCTRIAIAAMQRRERGEISKFEAWSTVALMLATSCTSIPLARWLGILPR